MSRVKYQGLYEFILTDINGITWYWDDMLKRFRTGRGHLYNGQELTYKKEDKTYSDFLTRSYSTGMIEVKV